MRTISSIISTYIILNIVLLTGCSDKTHNSLNPATSIEQGNISTGRGNISFTVNWTDKVSSSRVIPTNTEKIVVTVTQQGSKVGETTIIRPESTGTISNIPIGSVVVSAQAKDSADIVVASGSTGVTVLLGQTVPTKLVLSTNGGGSVIYGEKTNPTDGATMVWVPGGSFTMGTPYDNWWTPATQQVTLSGYWMYKFEVTVAQYCAFCIATGRALPSFPSGYSGSGEIGWNDSTLQQHPIVNVTWYDCKAYVDWAGVTLPTEAQWEYAARGPEGRNYPWGGTATSGDPHNGWDQMKCVNYSNSYSVGKITWPVGSFPVGASWCGTHDMAGNAWEWCDDWYGSYSLTPVTNPTGSISGISRVVRGVSWNGNDGDNYYRGAYRGYHYPNGGNGIIGFRCVFQVP